MRSAGTARRAGAAGGSKGVSVIYLLYNAALLAAAPLIAVGLAVRVARGKSVQGWSERWGKVAADAAAVARHRVWVHAASVGEVGAVQPLLERYRCRHPGAHVTMTVITPGGHEVAGRLVGSVIDALHYAPFDAPWVVRRVARTLRPNLFIGVETELWPNLLHAVRAVGARTVLVNARISDRSFPRYRRLRGLLGWTLGQFDLLLAQSDRDADRLRALGALPERVRTVGNTKFDQAAPPLTAAERGAVRDDLRLPAGAPVWVTASTRTSEEERVVTEAYGLLRASVPDLAIVHAPRHVERADEVCQALDAAGLVPVRRTQLAAHGGDVSCLVLDTFGELARVLAVADVAFIGNSLVEPGGGQNPLQALAQGVPVLQGPYVSNFRDIAAMVEQGGVGRTVVDAASLADEGVRLLRDAGARAEVGRRAIELVEANRGAADRYADAIDELERGTAA